MLHSSIFNSVKLLLTYWQYNLRWVSVTEEEMVAEKGMTFLEVLEKIEQISDNTVDKGTQFERLIQHLLQTTPVYGCNDGRTKVYL
ncbi:MAG: hypothetical protein IJ730_07610 [Alphaproteobacteria bacterium]|nr:hypothetical protein [Alphaproteobacteria bacterium]